MKNPRVLCILFSAVLLSVLPLDSLLACQEEPEIESAGSPDEEPEAPVVSEEIQVYGDWPEVPVVRTLDRDELPEVPLGDGADLLRSAAGVSVGRMGGHGLEPRVRGLGESSLNVLVDGAYIHGGCPNRMDPPSSFAAPDAFDEVTVIRGVQSLRYGPGGSAGTVVFERNMPSFQEPRGWRAEASTAYGSWHEQPELAFDGSLAREGFFLRAQAGRRNFDSYEDGDGETVRSAFDSGHASLMLGFGRPSTGQVELSLEGVRTDDALFAGAGMDSPEDAADTYRLRLERDERILGLVDLQADLYYATVDHLMDNYSLRPLTAPMAMRVPSNSDTHGGRISGVREISENLGLTLGVDYQENRREALRYAGPSPEQVGMLQSVMWPDATLGQGGLLAEGTQLLGTRSRLLFGGRVDRFTAKAAKADLQPGGMNRSPNELYEYYYGFREEDWSDTAVSGLLRFERFLKPKLTFFTGLSRSSRAADATERFLGADSPAAANRWVGNPRLALARHTQWDLGLSSLGSSTTWSVAGFVDRADDFILRDRAHGQEGILQVDNATIYRNVEARLLGAELEGSYRPTERLQLSGAASWVRGDNLTDDRPLAQIPPLQGWLQLGYGSERWRAAGVLRWATRQTRVDDDPLTGSGQDYGETPGYGVLDLSGGCRILRSLWLVAGVDNLFDRTYANHLNRANLFDPDPVQINEPGRTLWVRLSWRGGAQGP